MASLSHLEALFLDVTSAEMHLHDLTIVHSKV